jgi:hypothetical protein
MALAITPAPVESAVLHEVPLRLHHVEIRAAGTKELVTIIEILSPVNKQPRHKAFREYLRKRRNLLRSTTHLMEIDLLRAGSRRPLEIPVPYAPYYVTLARSNRRPKVEVWPIQLADSLPVLPVPLLEPDPDVPLDLAQAVHAAYEHGAYEADIDYGCPPEPPLTSRETAWLDALLRQAERR